MSPKNPNNVIDISNRLPQSAEAEAVSTPNKKKPNYVLRRLGAGAAAAVTLLSVTGKASMDYLHSEPTHQDIPSRTEIANPGDTLWDISKDVKNVEDRREVTNWMEESSPDLADGSVDVGDEVVVPVDAKDLN